MDKGNIKKAIKEVNQILKYIPVEEKNKINKKFLEFLEKNEDKEYNFEFEPSKEFEDGDLLNETVLLLQMIYRDYWCTEEEKKK